jgi:dTMP kinase
MFIADYLSWDKIECNDGNKMRDINDIHEEVYRLVKKQ